MKILVTGGSGFIGRNFISYINHNYPDDEIINCDKLTFFFETEALIDDYSKYKFYKGDITDKEFVRQLFQNEKPDIVVNFAAESHVDRSIRNPDLFVKTNVLGTVNLMEASLFVGVKRFHQVSTDEVYGDLPLTQNDSVFTETSLLHPSSPYASSKAAADLIALSYFRTYGLPVTISRCSNNYGPYQYSEKLIPLVISRAINNQYIPVYGTGKNIREWIHVLDHCSAIDLIMRNGTSGEIYNVGSGIELNNLEIIEIILNYLNKPASLISFVKDRKGHDLRYAINSDKINNELGWKAEHDFFPSLIEVIDWYLKEPEWLKYKHVDEL